VDVAGYLRSGGDPVQYHFSVENISAGGVFIRTDRVIPDGTPVDLSLVRPGIQEAIQLTGRIVGGRSPDDPDSPPGLRIQFDAPPEQVWERIEVLLRSLGLNNLSDALNEASPSPALEGEPPDMETRVKHLQQALEEAKRELASRTQRITDLERIVVRAKEALAQRNAYVMSSPTPPDDG
jgi:hypothetical protein